MVTGWCGTKGSKFSEANYRKVVDQENGPVLHRTSRIKSQGVYGSGESKDVAKAILRSVERGRTYENALDHYCMTRSGCDLFRGRLKPI